jgi:AcrR family transcriptional regulator
MTTDDVAELIVNAAERCFADHGVAKTSMSQVAAEADVSRTTLYRRFAEIEDVLQAVFVREFDRFEVRLAKRLAPLDDPADRLVEIVVSTAENVPDNSGVARLVEGPRSGPEARALAVGRAALNERIEVMIGEPLNELAAAGRLSASIDRTEMIEWIRRIVLSLAVSPQPRSRPAAARRAHVAALLVPALCPQSHTETV